MPPIRRLTAALLLTPLLAGCFASSDPGGDDSAEDDARLRVALAFPPTAGLSPYSDDATLLTRLGVTEGLTRLDANGTAAPALAESWHRENDRSWVFSLREARFQDGGDVTPKAVAGALTRAAAAEPVPAALAGVKLTAEATGNGEVRVTTDSPDPVLPQRLSSPALVVLSPKAYKKPERPSPVGTATGPFEISQQSGTRATLDRFDGHWGGRALAAGVDARFVADGQARTNALRSGEVDIAESVPFAQAGSLKKGVAREVPTARTTALYLNSDKGVFADAGVRAAARAAVDPSALAEDVYEGHADAGRGLYGPALSWTRGERPEPTGRAKAVKPPKGTLTLATYDNRPELPEIAQVVQQQLEKAGFTVKLEVREYSRIESDVLEGRFDAFVSTRSTMLDTGDPVSILRSDFGCDGSYNLSLLCDRGLDRKVEAAAGTDDQAARRKAALGAEAVLLGTDAFVPLAHQRLVHGVDGAVSGAVLDPYERTLVGLGTRR
ncbi:ABC transporter substrate-binding protein [Streptomyces sp. 549]|uniref:ABC transporter substrate-binding protein n=1 Tax=Streptomyces sp. 549 TaxID=3049076 RepID=UPI0024C39E5A|nr:ABC transporter substrate-binding protein [Streptomyces sp. 549]MDK1472029.1 ABC transporter substrate-binding protein [Streptomyces sp. 549]